MGPPSVFNQSVVRSNTGLSVTMDPEKIIPTPSYCRRMERIRRFGHFNDIVALEQEIVPLVDETRVD